MSENLDTNNIIATQTPSNTSFSTLLQEICDFVTLPEELVRVAFAVALAGHFRISPPLWLMMIGVPSSGKTDLITLFRNLDITYFLDTLTLNGLVSGKRQSDEPKDLLPKLDGKTLIIKDLSGLFSMTDETVRKILGELTCAFDGVFEKFSSERGLVTYESLFSLMSCITPAAINAHQRYLSIVGPRFVFYRIPVLNDEETKRGFSLVWSKTDRREILREIHEKVEKFYSDLLEKNKSLFQISDPEIRKDLENLSSLMARSRGIVVMQKSSFKDDSGKEVVYYEAVDKQSEAPWRALHQLRILAVFLAIVDGRDQVNESDISTLKHIVLSSMPAERAEALDFILTNTEVTARKLSEKLGKSVRTCQRLLKELETLEIIDAYFGNDEKSKHYILHEDFGFLKGNSTTHSEFLSQSLPQKPVPDYDNDEVLAVLDMLTNMLQDQTLTETEQGECKRKALEMEAEAKKRGIYQEKMAVSDQILIDETLKESIPVGVRL